MILGVELPVYKIIAPCLEALLTSVIQRSYRLTFPPLLCSHARLHPPPRHYVTCWLLISPSMRNTCCPRGGPAGSTSTFTAAGEDVNYATQNPTGSYGGVSEWAWVLPVYWLCWWPPGTRWTIMNSRRRTSLSPQTWSHDCQQIKSSSCYCRSFSESSAHFCGNDDETCFETMKCAATEVREQ